MNDLNDMKRSRDLCLQKIAEYKGTIEKLETAVLQYNARIAAFEKVEQSYSSPVVTDEIAALIGGLNSTRRNGAVTRKNNAKSLAATIKEVLATGAKNKLELAQATIDAGYHPGDPEKHVAAVYAACMQLKNGGKVSLNNKVWSLVSDADDNDVNVNNTTTAAAQESEDNVVSNNVPTSVISKGNKKKPVSV